MIAAATGFVMLGDRYTRSHPPAAAPADLCSAIGIPVFERLVPAAARVTEATYSSGGDAACYYITRDSPPGNDGYGLLHVRLLRYGGFFWRSGTARASNALDHVCDGPAVAGQLHDATGLGDEACAADSDEGPGGTGASSVILRRGADVIWIDYSRHPATTAQTQQAVVDVAMAALAGVP